MIIRLRARRGVQVFTVPPRSLPAANQIWGHIAGAPPPPNPTTVRTPLGFYREENSAFSSLVDKKSRILQNNAGVFFNIFHKKKIRLGWTRKHDLGDSIHEV